MSSGLAACSASAAALISIKGPPHLAGCSSRSYSSWLLILQQKREKFVRRRAGKSPMQNACILWAPWFWGCLFLFLSLSFSLFISRCESNMCVPQQPTDRLGLKLYVQYCASTYCSPSLLTHVWLFKPMVGENRRLVHYRPMDFPSWPI